MAMTIPWIFISLVTATTVFVYHRLRRALNLPRPPGPSGLPIIGNLLDSPKEYSWIKYLEWARKYGERFSFALKV